MPIERLMATEKQNEQKIQAYEKIAAVIVAGGLVAGNLFLFSPMRIDNRSKDLHVEQKKSAAN